MSESPHPAPGIEDNWLDIVEKARKGRRIDRCALCSRAGIEPRQWREAGGSPIDEELAVRAGRVLGLGVIGLLSILRGQYAPRVALPAGLDSIPTPFPQPGCPQGSVNAYLIEIPGSSDAVLIDGGSEPGPVLAEIEKRHLNISTIFVTHAHPDHIAALPTVHSLFPEAPVYCHDTERIAPCMTAIAHGAVIEAGPLKIEARHTPGHSKGGMSYVVTGLSQGVVFTGDALFAGSVGRADTAWAEALDAVRKQILSLPPETVVCPGHGTLTSVAYESAHNPVFARTA